MRTQTRPSDAIDTNTGDTNTRDTSTGDTQASYIEANRAAWNEAAPIHALRTFESLRQGFSTPGFSSLNRPHEVEQLRALDLQGKNVIQLCCNNGRELLSIKNLFRADYCLGVDISDEFVGQARALNEAANLNVEFLRANVFELPESVLGRFDLVYITVGAFGWMPDCAAFTALISSLLRPGGQVFIYEMHPLLDAFDETDYREPLAFRRSYMQSEPNVLSHGLDYLGNGTYESRAMYWFHHKTSDIIGGLLRAGMSITAFDEFDHDISNVFAHLERLVARPPLSYILQAVKLGSR
jgi:SAM-dependent methyltransferase